MEIPPAMAETMPVDSLARSAPRLPVSYAIGHPTQNRVVARLGLFDFVAPNRRRTLRTVA
jgi:hypothetical protein